MTADETHGGASSRPIPWPLKRDPSEIRVHPQLGEYVEPSSSWKDGLWTHFRETSHGERFRLTGRSPRPTDVQVRLWSEIDRRLTELTRAAVASIVAPSVAPLPRAFSRDEINLSEVRLEPDGVIEMFFRSRLGDEINMWPYATFRDWSVTESGWTI